MSLVQILLVDDQYRRLDKRFLKVAANVKQLNYRGVFDEAA